MTAWKIQKEGAKRPVKTFDNKKDAVDFSRDIAKNQPLGQLKILKKDGTFQEKRTYGKDPFPPKG
ncbi:MAG: DUF2188 domain-containing protein [Candidatus Aminicenantes bacterium]|nr:DUF2188 domain-containing protein [Candidatus Aminicenantes bacterium]